MNKRFSFYIFLGLTPLMAMANKTINFEDLPQLIETHEAVETLKKERQRLNDRPSHFSQSFIPSIELETGLEQFERPGLAEGTQPYYSIKSTLNLYNKGLDILEDQEQSLENQKAQLEERMFRKELNDDANSALADYLFFSEKEKLLIELNKNIQKQYERAKKTVRSGQISETLLLKLEMKNEEISFLIEEAAFQKANQLERLRTYLHDSSIESSNLIQSFPLTTPEFSHLESKKIQENNQMFHDFTKVSNRIQRLSWEKQQGQVLPQLDLIASIGQETQRQDAEFSNARERRHKRIGLSISFDIDRLFTNNSKTDTLKARARYKEVLSTHRLHHLEQEREQLRQELIMLEKKIEYYRGLIAKERNYFQKLESDYSKGIRSIQDLVDSLEGLYQKGLKLKSSQRDFYKTYGQLIR